MVLVKKKKRERENDLGCLFTPLPPHPLNGKVAGEILVKVRHEPESRLFRDFSVGLEVVYKGTERGVFLGGGVKLKIYETKSREMTWRV